MKLEYSSNNSGGHWWLDDAAWKRLAEAGWTVEWGGLYFCHYTGMMGPPPGKPEPCKKGSPCSGHVKYTLDEVLAADKLSKPAGYNDRRYMSALAHNAWIETDDIAVSLRQFEEVTGTKVTDEGCNCCGAPHSFNWEDDNGESHYASGEALLPILYPDRDIPGSIREVLDRE